MVSVGREVMGWSLWGGDGVVSVGREVMGWSVWEGR